MRTPFVFLLGVLLGCPPAPPAPPVPTSTSTAPTSAATTTGAGVCQNTCTDYSPSWATTCPAGSRCLTFVNDCTSPVLLSYQVGCNGDGTPGAPQCNCTAGPLLGANGGEAVWTIVDGDYANCTPWTPACLTSGLAVIVNGDTDSGPPQALCSMGTRVEFTAGNAGNVYNHFDSYNIDVEPSGGGNSFYSLPLSYAPDLTCAHDSANHDCRPLVCDSATCPDAYSTPTTGGCPDGRSPQGACQDTFGPSQAGYTVTLCPSPVPASCQNAVACP